jgi:hypothetical protein
MSDDRNDRVYWLATMLRIVNPVLTALAERRLKATMPVEGDGERTAVTGLEALGRSLAGLAPWLESVSDDAKEERLRYRYAELARAAIDAGTDPASPDFLNFTHTSQPIVDAAFLSHALLRAPSQLIDGLEPRVRGNLAKALASTRGRKPGFSNWLLFAAMMEAALYRLGEPWDRMRVDFALKQLEQWYVGDGAYSDGPEFHWDNYNSFVIQPMLVDIIEAVGDEEADWKRLRQPVLKRAARYADVQEKLISPEGTFPAIGRSLAYRFGAFQHLAQMALQHRLPEHVAPAQVRCALTRVIRNMIEAPGTFDEQGWLRIGFCGHQPGLGERYISTGSLYLCSTVFLPLGLTPSDPFWSGEEMPWSSRKIWSGEAVLIDYAYRD